jgi:hypothetical protein
VGEKAELAAVNLGPDEVEAGAMTCLGDEELLGITGLPIYASILCHRPSMGWGRY